MIYKCINPNFQTEFDTININDIPNHLVYGSIVDINNIKSEFDPIVSNNTGKCHYKWSLGSGQSPEPDVFASQKLVLDPTPSDRTFRAEPGN